MMLIFKIDQIDKFSSQGVPLSYSNYFHNSWRKCIIIMSFIFYISDTLSISATVAEYVDVIHILYFCFF